MAVRGMRKVIAERMYASLQETAQLTMDMDVAMDDCVKLRGQLIEEWANDGVRPSYTDITMKAVAKALLDHPRMNAQFLGAEMNIRGEVHVGMAVALEEGLVVPVVRHVDQIGLKEIAQESSRLAGLAREGKLGLDDMAGGTFTRFPRWACSEWTRSRPSSNPPRGRHPRGEPASRRRALGGRTARPAKRR